MLPNGTDYRAPLLSAQSELDELAAELLTLENEEELDHFFSDFVKKAVGGIKQFAGSQLGKTIVSGLKTVAKQALPTVAGALGNAIGGSTGANIGKQVGSFAASKLEFEDRYLDSIVGETDTPVASAVAADPAAFQKAREMIKVAAATTRRAKRTPYRQGHLRNMVREAMRDALVQHAPTIVQELGEAEPVGRWYRRNGELVLMGT